MMHPEKKETLEHEFFTRIPKARKINPVFRGIFDLMYQAHIKAKPGSRVLNIYSSADLSGKREEVYRDFFFKDCDMENMDFWEDSFKYDGVTHENRHKLPFPDNHFDVVVTTKVIMEHSTEPSDVMKEFCRVLKRGGEAFIVAPHIRRQHQKPYDYFRFTEFALAYLAKKAGFVKWDIATTDGYFYTIAAHGYFFERSITMPKFLENFFDFLYQWLWEPFWFFLHRFDNGYGRDFACYFLLRAEK
jgi:SAM-dependent methyltransferase